MVPYSNSQGLCKLALNSYEDRKYREDQVPVF